jgi:pyruvate-ferredoxin/flavodoxin oxidoreductase
MLAARKHLSRKTFWMYGGDGWAYDIGYGGLDHVLSSGENVNVFIVDTEVYSNTGGQASKATPLGAVAQFTASGKRSGKKDLGALARTYGNVYVAQVSMGADPAQLVRAIREAEYYEGPSVIIAYAPCIAHGIAAGMGMAQQEAAKAVDAGYWHLYRYHPDTGEFTLDSREPTIPYGEFLAGEVRYASLERTFPDNAEALFKKAEQQAASRYEAYKQLQK